MSISACAQTIPQETETAKDRDGEISSTHCEDVACRLQRLSQALPNQGPKIPPWRVIISKNFRVVYQTDSRQAWQVARRLETERVKQLIWWGQDPTKIQWKPKCDVYLYASQQMMQLMTGGAPKLAQADARSSRLSHGLMLKRQIDLFATDRHLFHNTLSHELSHVILREVISGKRPPLWINEGLATLWESKRSTQRRYELARHALQRGRAFPLATVLQLAQYPDYLYLQNVFYAQSMSLTNFLLRQRPKRVFFAFLQQISPRDVRGKRGLSLGQIENALAEHYGIADAGELERQWRQYLRKR